MAQGKFGGGDGTISNPFLIEDAADLNAIRFNPSSNYKLAVSINLGIAPYNAGKGWLPIKDFCGTLDGNGKKIYNLYINRPEKDYCGLFEKVLQLNNMALAFSDLCIENAKVTGKQNVGLIAGALELRQTIGAIPTSFFFERCYTTGKVYAENFGGGLVGQFMWAGTLDGVAWSGISGTFNFAQDCFIDVALNAIAVGDKFGALAGFIQNGDATKNIVVKYVISACTFSNLVNGVASSLAPKSYGTLQWNGSLHATSTACYFDSTRWGIFGGTNGTTGKTTDELVKTRVDEFDKRVMADGKLIWGYRDGKRYPMLRKFFADRYFVKTKDGYCVYDNGAWVIKYTTKPTREEAIKDGMLSLQDIPFTAWDALRAAETTVDVINVLELSNGTTQQAATMAMTLDTAASVDNKNYFRKEIVFNDFGHSIVTINKGVVV